MANKGYTVKECIEIVNCCYFVGSCHACPAHKATGYANIIRCVGAKEVGEALLGILEPLHNAQRMKEPSLFDVVEAVEQPQDETVEAEDGRSDEDQGQDLVSEDHEDSDQAAA